MNTEATQNDENTDDFYRRYMLAKINQTHRQTARYFSLKSCPTLGGYYAGSIRAKQKSAAAKQMIGVLFKQFKDSGLHRIESHAVLDIRFNVRPRRWEYFNASARVQILVDALVHAKVIARKQAARDIHIETRIAEQIDAPIMTMTVIPGEGEPKLTDKTQEKSEEVEPGAAEPVNDDNETTNETLVDDDQDS